MGGGGGIDLCSLGALACASALRPVCPLCLQASCGTSGWWIPHEARTAHALLPPALIPVLCPACFAGWLATLGTCTLSAGGPPFLLAKGGAADGFTAGVPILAPPGPELPGYTRFVAAGLWAQPGYPCQQSLV